MYIYFLIINQILSRKIPWIILFYCAINKLKKNDIKVTQISLEYYEIISRHNNEIGKKKKNNKRKMINKV